MRFVFLADTQLGAYATFSGKTEQEIAAFRERGMRVEAVPPVEGFAWDADRYRAAVGMINAIRPDFVIIGGDMIDDPSSQDQTEELLRITRDLDRDIPMRWAPGNHDIAPDTVVPTVHSIEKYREVFGPDYFAFGSDRTRFIVLNTVVLDQPQHVPGLLEEQFTFLEHELEQASEVDHVVLFGHHPLFVASADEPDTYWNIPLERRRRMLKLIHRYGVEIAFAGHWHRNSLAFDQGFQMVTSGPVGYPLGDDPSGIRVVDVSADQIEHSYQPIAGT